MAARSDLSPADVARALADEAFDGRAAQRAMEPVFRGEAPARLRRRAPRPAAALAYVFADTGETCFVLTLRREHLRDHSGQVSFPGGRPEPGETPWQTALREAHEEVGLDPTLPRRLGRLTPVYIPVTHTALDVHVGTGAAPAALVAEPSEVAAIARVPLAHLLDPARRDREWRRIRGREVEVPFFRLAAWKVWGATAMALADLGARLAAVR